MSKSLYHVRVELGPGLTDVLHDARVAAASDEDRLEGAGVHDPFHEHVLARGRPVEIRRCSGNGNNDLPRRDVCMYIYTYIWIYICMYIYTYIWI